MWFSVIGVGLTFSVVSASRDKSYINDTYIFNIAKKYLTAIDNIFKNLDIFYDKNYLIGLQEICSGSEVYKTDDTTHVSD